MTKSQPPKIGILG